MDAAVRSNDNTIGVCLVSREGNSVAHALVLRTFSYPFGFAWTGETSSFIADLVSIIIGTFNTT